METQTWLSRHYKFISAENINILSVLSDDFLQIILLFCNFEKKKSSDETESIVIFYAEINL